MKKTLIIAVTTLAIVCSACSCIKTAKKTKLSGVEVQKNMTIAPFQSLNVSSAIEVTFVKGDSQSLDISGDSVLINRLKIENDGGCLNLYIKSKSQFEELSDIDNNVKIKITSDKFPSDLQISGASSFETKDNFETTNDIIIRGSGASKIKGLNLVAKKTYIDLSGASQLGELKIKADTADIQLSGASKIEDLDMVIANSTSFTLSGASQCEAKGVFADTKCDLSGASNADIEGSFGLLDMSLSGASEMDIKGTAKEVTEISNGASEITKNITLTK